MADYQHLGMKRDGHVLTVSMSNPPLHTMVPSEVIELNAMMDDVEADNELRVLVLTGGSDEYFVRHYDVGELANAADNLRSATGAVNSGSGADPGSGSFHRLMRRLEAWQGVTIAAINGNAAGGGFELALACDFRVMRAGEFRVGLPETSVGIIPGAGGTQRLPRLIGPGRAMDFIMHARLVLPEEALDVGMIHRVFPAANWQAEVEAFAQGLARRAPLAIRATKAAIRDGLTRPLYDGIALEGELFGELMRTEDAAHALRQVAEGKPPGDFSGR